KVIQLTFVGEDVESPLITKLVRNFELDVNIVQGKISQTRNGSYGTLFIHIDGSNEEILRAIQFIEEQQVGVEVMTHA
ncbi:MAG TPA: NIL domain-containing protein, partial [Ureibacillus sp.]|nr:NIL domain-containing protein [Ureibacillus sp.]